MKIRTRLYLNMFVTLAGAAVIGGGCLLGMRYTQGKLLQLTEKTAPYQLKLMELQRGLQEYTSSLLRVSTVTDGAELAVAGAQADNSLKEARKTAAELKAIRGDDDKLDKKLQEMASLGAEIMAASGNRIQAEGEANESYRTVSARLKDVSEKLRAMDTAMRKTQRDASGQISSTNANLNRTVQKNREVLTMKDYLKDVRLSVLEIAAAESRTELTVAQSRFNGGVRWVSKGVKSLEGTDIGAIVADTMTDIVRKTTGPEGLIALRTAILAAPTEDVKRDFGSAMKYVQQKLGNLAVSLEEQIEKSSDSLSSENRKFDESVRGAGVAGDVIALSGEVVSLGAEISGMTGLVFGEHTIEALEARESEIRVRVDQAESSLRKMVAILGASGRKDMASMTGEVQRSLGEIRSLLWAGNGAFARTRAKIDAETRAGEMGGRLKELVVHQRAEGAKGVSLAQVEQGQAIRAVNRIVSVNLVLGLVVLVLSVVIARKFVHEISTGFARLVGHAEEIASGELRNPVPEEGYEEMRTLARAFNTMAVSLRGILGQIQETSARLGAFTGQISTVIQAQASGAAQEAASVAEVTATLEELARTSQHISGNTQRVQEAVVATVDMARQGARQGRDGVDAMSQIKGRVEDIERKTRFLGDKSQEIGKVMSIIREIASEIHLLSLNAAIESAAAGEAGRRFAVVSSEVRRLAEKAREATETIRTAMTEIQSAIGESVVATQQGAVEVDRLKDTAIRSSEAFDAIIAMVEETSGESAQTLLATQQQTSANRQVLEAIRQIADTVQSTAVQMRESAGSTEELKAMASNLQERTTQFRI